MQLLGVCTRERPLFIITEFMELGNLLEFLRSERGKKEVGRAAPGWWGVFTFLTFCARARVLLPCRRLTPRR